MTEVRKYLPRRYLSLEEEREFLYDGAVSSTTWVAEARGPLTPTHEEISLSRRGSSAAEAEASLVAALAEQGWELGS